MNEILLTVAGADRFGGLWWGVVLWIAVIGACVGSFLNVVVYRLPQGLGLSRPGSHCPKCKHPIRWYHNVPVLGWIVLGGRCRDCGARISARYPAVEAATAAMFAVVAAAGPLSGGAHLPLGPIATDPVSPAHGLSPAELWGVSAVHLVVLCGLLWAGLAQFDGTRPPADAIILPGAILFVAGLFWIPLQSAAVVGDVPGRDLVSGLTGRALLGIENLAVGAVLGIVGSIAVVRHPSGRNSIGMVPWLTAMISVVFGWPATLWIVGAGAAIDLVRVALALRSRKHVRCTWALALWASAVLWVTGGAGIVRGAIAAPSAAAALLPPAMVLLVGSLAIRAMHRRRR